MLLLDQGEDMPKLKLEQDGRVVLTDDYAGLCHTASDWHSGQSSAFYALASTGTITVGLRAEAMRCLRSIETSEHTDDDVLGDIENLEAIRDLEECLGALYVWHADSGTVLALSECQIVYMTDTQEEHISSGAGWVGKLTTDIWPSLIMSKVYDVASWDGDKAYDEHMRDMTSVVDYGDSVASSHNAYNDLWEQPTDTYAACPFCDIAGADADHIQSHSEPRER